MADPIEMLMQDLGWPSSRPPSDVVVARAWAAADGVVAVTVEIRLPTGSSACCAAPRPGRGLA